MHQATWKSLKAGGTEPTLSLPSLVQTGDYIYLFCFEGSPRTFRRFDVTWCHPRTQPDANQTCRAQSGSMPAWPIVFFISQSRCRKLSCCNLNSWGSNTRLFWTTYLWAIPKLKWNWDCASVAGDSTATICFWVASASLPMIAGRGRTVRPWPNRRQRFARPC